MTKNKIHVSDSFKRMVSKRNHFIMRVSRSKHMYCINYGGRSTSVWLSVITKMDKGGHLEILTSCHENKLEDSVIKCYLKHKENA